MLYKTLIKFTIKTWGIAKVVFFIFVILFFYNAGLQHSVGYDLGFMIFLFIFIKLSQFYDPSREIARLTWVKMSCFFLIFLLNVSFLISYFNNGLVENWDS